MQRLRYLLLLIATFAAASTARCALPILPAPKQVAEGDETGPHRFNALHIESAEQLAPYRAVIGELESLADSSANRPLVIRLTRSERASRRFLQRYATETPYDALDKEFYGLTLAGDTVRIVASTEAGGRHALQTLKQLLRADYAHDLVVADWCDLPLRIFMDDISRGAVPTMEQVRRQIRDLAELKYNAMMFYIEHVVRVESHPDFAPADGRFTLDEIREIGRYAASYGIDLIGNFQSFGHFEQILSQERYRDLGDTETMISTTDPRARKFLEEVLGELCEAFPSHYFHVNCDETWDIGNGRSRERAEAVGKERFYAEHLRFLHDVLRRHDKTLMMWADWVLKYPRTLDLLPKEIVLLTWNYDARDDFSDWIRPLRGRRLLVCPGVHSSGRMVPDMRAAEGNRRFIAQGYEQGAEGALLTSWDEGALHSCHHLCFGIAQAAETMWDTRRTTVDDDFAQRYEIVRFGRENGFVDACRELMHAGDLPLLNGMNDRIFYQRFAPEPDRPLNIDRGQLRTADSIARRCSASFRQALHSSARNRTEIEAWLYAAESYRFIARSRLGMARIAELHAEATREALIEALALCDTLRRHALELEGRFSKLWLYENQYHSYERGIEAYREKQDEIARIRTRLMRSLRLSDSGCAVPSNAEAGLEVRDRQNAYLCFWLTIGPFPGCGPDDDPLAEAGGERNAAPTPGLRFRIGPTEYKWTKTESLNGLTVDGNEFYRSGGDATLYAYAQLTCDRACDIELLVGYAGGFTLFCNGERIYRGEISNSYAPDSHRIAVHLHEGTNRLLVKLRQEVPEWLFSCIVEGASVSSRKHKYTVK